MAFGRQHGEEIRNSLGSEALGLPDRRRKAPARRTETVPVNALLFLDGSLGGPPPECSGHCPGEPSPGVGDPDIPGYGAPRGPRAPSPIKPIVIITQAKTGTP